MQEKDVTCGLATSGSEDLKFVQSMITWGWVGATTEGQIFTKEHTEKNVLKSSSQNLTSQKICYLCESILVSVDPSLFVCCRYERQ